MVDHNARDHVASVVTPEALGRLDALVALVIAENGRQNLIGPSTVATIWQRHVLDSCQLIALAPGGWHLWLDIGSGGGFPGLAIACASERPMVLVEPRTRRAEFLREAACELRLDWVTVMKQRVETLQMPADVISSRAVAPPRRLLQLAAACSGNETRWLLPVGRWSSDDTALLAGAEPGMTFHVEQSLSDTASTVLVGVGRPA